MTAGQHAAMPTDTVTTDATDAPTWEATLSRYRPDVEHLAVRTVRACGRPDLDDEARGEALVALWLCWRGCRDWSAVWPYLQTAVRRRVRRLVGEYRLAPVPVVSLTPGAPTSGGHPGGRAEEAWTDSSKMTVHPVADYRIGSDGRLSLDLRQMLRLLTPLQAAAVLYRFRDRLRLHGDPDQNGPDAGQLYSRLKKAFARLRGARWVWELARDYGIITDEQAAVGIAGLVALAAAADAG